MSNHCYSFEETELKKLDIQLLYITQARYDSDWHSTEHIHHFTELFYVLNGKGYFLVENEKLPVAENDMVIVNPNVSHTEMGNSEDPLEYIVLGISGLAFKDETLDTAYNYSLHNFRSCKDDFLFYLKTLVREAVQKEEGYETICQNLLESLVLNLIRRTHKKVALTPSKKVTKECRFVEQYIEEHFTENITLQKLSELTYLNKYYLVHSFKEYNGTSPINYLINKRISESKHLLETTNHSVAKIAAMVGFSSQSYFSQVFKRETNMTPNEWRKTQEKS